MVSVTSARPSAGRPAVPAKMTSSILPPRRLLAPCSPMTQARASTTLDLPEPFGPTTHVMPGSKRRVVDEAKDLNPRSVKLFRYKGRTLLCAWSGTPGKLISCYRAAAPRSLMNPAARVSLAAGCREIGVRPERARARQPHRLLGPSPLRRQASRSQPEAAVPRPRGHVLADAAALPRLRVEGLDHRRARGAPSPSQESSTKSGSQARPPHRDSGGSGR